MRRILFTCFVLLCAVMWDSYYCSAVFYSLLLCYTPRKQIRRLRSVHYTALRLEPNLCLITKTEACRTTPTVGGSEKHGRAAYNAPRFSRPPRHVVSRCISPSLTTRSSYNGRLNGMSDWSPHVPSLPVPLFPPVILPASMPYAAAALNEWASGFC